MHRRDLLFLLVALIVIVPFVLGPLLWLVKIFLTGISELHFDFLFALPENAGREGGIFPMIVSTFYIIALCLLFCIPLGFLVVYFLLHNEMENKYTFWDSWIRYAMASFGSAPSIVFGLLGVAIFADFFGFGVSILSGALTLSVMVLPYFVSGSLSAFQKANHIHGLAAKSSGLQYSSIFFKILFPAAISGIWASFFVALTRALAETAALLFTSGYALNVPKSIFDSGRALSVHIFDLAFQVPGGSAKAYASASVLVVIIIFMNVLAKIFQKGVSFGS
ncbi:MAG: ABC transporter permease subunit [Candidatus Hydrogenedentota bacterium]|nr:MAG: ABC transporter permease subunit [Candidatus Hydrogenedentota bacterium]